MTTATKELKPTKPGSTTLDAWEHVVFLVREPNRKGQEVHYVRVIIGDLPPIRFGPYGDEEEARCDFKIVADRFDHQYDELRSDLEFAAHAWCEFED